MKQSIFKTGKVLLTYKVVLKWDGVSLENDNWWNFAPIVKNVFFRKAADSELFSFRLVAAF